MSAPQLRNLSEAEGDAFTAVTALTLNVLHELLLLWSGQVGIMYQSVSKSAAVMGPLAILTCPPEI